MSLIKRLSAMFQPEKGQALVEYALLVCLIAIMVGTTLIYFGQYLVHIFVHFVEIIAAWCA